MITKLTLTLDDQVIRRSKRYAKDKKTSISSLVGNYLNSLTLRQNESSGELTPIVKSLMGSFRVPKDFDYKSILREEKFKRHG